MYIPLDTIIVVGVSRPVEDISKVKLCTRMMYKCIASTLR